MGVGVEREEFFVLPKHLKKEEEAFSVVILKRQKSTLTISFFPFQGCT